MVNSHPVKSEMSVATPKSQAKEPIQLDIIIVCRKATASLPTHWTSKMPSPRQKQDFNVCTTRAFVCLATIAKSSSMANC